MHHEAAGVLLCYIRRLYYSASMELPYGHTESQKKRPVRFFTPLSRYMCPCERLPPSIDKTVTERRNYRIPER